MNGMSGNVGAAAAGPIVSMRKPGEKYDVFLSFRGPDTREGFADCLFEFLSDAGIRVFMDDEELRVGESIGWEIKRAIYDSKLFVPVFSRRFASSKWCLREIEWMTDCLEEYPGKKEMLPVFYDVDAGDVKLKTDLYANALINHVKTSGQDNVERWRKALIKVPRLKGWNRADVKGQGKLIKRITHHICRKLEIKHRILPDHFIGIEEQVEDIMDMLDCGSRDVRIIVIHGMGGIGKTTLASAVFNKICWEFLGYSFLSNVRELSAENRIVDLQNKLLNDVLRFSRYNFRDANDAMHCIQGSLRKKNTLVVLDDVSDAEQIGKLVGMGEWLGLGSRVIITTRNLSCMANGEDIENNAWISQGKRIHIYQMRELDSDDSLRLLCQHAFGKDAPPGDYEQPSHDILSLMGGVPLAIEVIGSYLRQGSVAIWERMFNKLKKIPHERLYREILMSSYEILCDEEKEIFLDIVFFLAGYDKTTSFYYWEACNLFPEISLRTLISYALIKIDCYDRIQMHDLLRDLGREVDRRRSNGVLGRRSRLSNEDVKHLLLKRKGTKHVKALKLDSKYAHDFTPAELSGLSDIKLLELCGGNFVGEFQDGCLSDLRWFSWRDCALNFRGTNLYFENLTVLTLCDSNITETWAGWEQLKTARSLKSLELEGLNLSAIPNLSSFLSLERLVVNQSKVLDRIDPSIGDLKYLNSLELVNLFFYLGDIVHLPSSICSLKFLSRLVIEGFKLEQLPENIGELRGLETLEIQWCEFLRNLPDSIGDLKSLRILSLAGNGIMKLPESIGKLGKLTKLDVSRNKLRELPATIGGLVKLEVLDLSINPDLKGEVPGELVDLLSLRTLHLSWTGICGLPGRIFKLPGLQSLWLEYCDEIQELPNLPASLITLGIKSPFLKYVPNLSSMTNLVTLRLEDSGSCLNSGLDNLSRLVHLTISCENPSAMSVPCGLQTLTLRRCMYLSQWEWLASSKGLRDLHIFKSVATEIRLNGLEVLNNLSRLIIEGCESLEMVHDMSGLGKLKHLGFYECPKLVEIGGLAQLLRSLGHLDIWKCDSIPGLPDPSETKTRSGLRLTVGRCSKLLEDGRKDYSGPYEDYFRF